MAFPSNPVLGQTHTNGNGDSFTFTVKGVWKALNNSANGPRYTAGPEAPTTPKLGDYWFDTNAKVLKVWAWDATLYYWNLVGSSIYSGSEPPTGPTIGQLWYDVDDKKLYVWNVTAEFPTGYWLLLVDDAISATQLVITKVLPLTWNYDDERFNFEMFTSIKDYSWRDIDPIAVIATAAGDDTIDLFTNGGVDEGSTYVIYSSTGQILETFKVMSLLANNRIRATTSLNTSLNQAAGAKFARTSMQIDNKGSGIVKNGDVLYSKPLNALELWPNGEIALWRSAQGPGTFTFKYRIFGTEPWIDAEFKYSRSVQKGQYRQEVYVVDTTGVIEVRMSYVAGANETDVIQHLVLYGAPQNNNTGRVERPVNVTPADQATSVSVTTTLTGSAFRSLYALTQKGSHFQVARDKEFSQLVINTTNDFLASWVGVSGQSANFKGIVSTGAKEFTLVGEAGVVRITVDGAKTFTNGTYGTSDNIRAVTYNRASRILAVGDNGSIRYSDNKGGAWTGATAASSFAGVFRGAAMRGNYVVIVGDSGTIQRSTNSGAIWSSEAAANSYVGQFNAVAMDVNGRCIAVGNSGEIQTSADFGDNWVRRANAGAFAGNFYAIAMDDTGHAIAVGSSGEVQISSDYGSTWTDSPAPDAYAGNWRGVAMVGNWLVIVGDTGKIATSYNLGVTLTSRPPGGAETAQFNAVAIDVAGYSALAGETGKIQHVLMLDGEVGISYAVPAGADMLQLNQVYWWRLRYKDEAGFWSEFSKPTVFATSATLNYVKQPQNLSPAGGAQSISLSPTLQSSAFEYSGSADTHAKSQWQVSTNEAFSSTVYSTGDSDSLVTHSLPGNTLTDGTLYYWRVRHKGTNDGYSAWSVPTSFRSRSAPGTVSIIEPTNNQSITFKEGGAGITLKSSAFSSTSPGETHAKSQWQINDAADENTIIYDSGDSNNLTTFVAPNSAFDNSKTYYARVRHKGLNTGYSTWSSWLMFKTSDPLGEALYLVPGVYPWTVPAGVTQISVCCIAGGGYNNYGGAGAGALRFNTFNVVPGDVHYVVVGDEGKYNNANPLDGGLSSFGTLLTALGGKSGKFTGVGAQSDNVDQGGAGGTGTGGLGGNGGKGGTSFFGDGTSDGRLGCAGGAGGYNGDGGRGSSGPRTTGVDLPSGANPIIATAGLGGGGGGGAFVFRGSANGGGVGIYGQGANGAVGTEESSNGKNGSQTPFYIPNDLDPTGVFGSSGRQNSFGAGGNFETNTASGFYSNRRGAVRIIWGVNRLYPNQAGI